MKFKILLFFQKFPSLFGFADRFCCISPPYPIIFEMKIAECLLRRCSAGVLTLNKPHRHNRAQDHRHFLCECEFLPINVLPFPGTGCSFRYYAVFSSV